MRADNDLLRVASTSRRATVADYLACFALGAVLGGIFFLFI